MPSALVKSLKGVERAGAGSGGRARAEKGRAGRDCADRSIEFNMRQREEEDELSTGCLLSGLNFFRRDLRHVRMLSCGDASK